MAWENLASCVYFLHGEGLKGALAGLGKGRCTQLRTLRVVEKRIRVGGYTAPGLPPIRSPKGRTGPPGTLERGKKQEVSPPIQGRGCRRGRVEHYGAARQAGRNKGALCPKKLFAAPAAMAYVTGAVPWARAAFQCKRRMAYGIQRPTATLCNMELAVDAPCAWLFAGRQNAVQHGFSLGDSVGERRHRYLSFFFFWLPVCSWPNAGLLRARERRQLCRPPGATAIQTIPAWL
ncbi:hypothetical protein TraAM80_00072 [Trypanosoma rangeli]|uniref:Uncharacterized protein n=1 Tax=Trypanosoma rangeli TaxID=5698 RepID=A0A422P5H2_TRYRA|nr:uncharacterized protein TraAM80_00072 [Trypanosoma rangeli]RNF12914.1 hypothetical protein TraAM80_00072 [Trypanosoma rangeli]|eukprot:RNF12914.1 hypothetical protein TraAM80_00072 [Trypanosoma rangeli]